MPPTDNYIFWSAPARKEEEEEEEEISFEDALPQESEVLDHPNEKGKGRESMYVSLVESMVKTVLEHESFLLSEEELSFFNAYSTLTYRARYLLARLLVRKTGKWYRLDQLKYVAELGSQGIVDAMNELCGALGSRCETASLPQPTQSFADGGSSIPNSPTANGKANRKGGRLDFYAEDESIASLSDLLCCLSLEELKSAARTLKLPNTLTARKPLIECLLATSSTQTVFPNSPKAKSRNCAKDACSVKVKQTLLSFKPVAKASMQANVLRTMVLKCLKKCIRINDAINALFHRLHIIYFRSTEHPVSLLMPALLRKCRKRYYPLYTYVRTSDLFTSRETLLAYEDALRMEAAVDLMLEGNIDVELAEQHVNAWHRGHDEDEGSQVECPLPHTLRPRSSAPDGSESTDEENISTLRARSTSIFSSSRADDESDPLPQKESRTVTNAKYVISVFNLVYPRWQQLVHERASEGSRSGGLERFDEGYILTRIVHKGATAFGKLKDFDREISILQELLDQRRWRRGKRGAWYDRWALILMHHRARSKHVVDGQLVPLSKEEQEKILRDAMRVCINGLHDEDTHIVNRQALEGRLSRLEKRLKVPAKERHQCVGRLKKAPELKIVGERVKRHKGVALDSANKINNRAVVPISVQMQGTEAVRRHLDQLKASFKERWTGKSIWVGKSGEDVNVETLVLHHLEFDGFKGFHSEGSIVSTIFGLLFWDILFSSVPGAFETPYQSAPLDIATECFFFARRKAIEERLREIEDGKAPEILAHTDEKFRENNTMCVGVRWNEFSKQDLVEIVTCIGGKGLSVICRLFCEDYGGRHSGIPDLLVWRAKHGVAKFVEVKGPGDNLSENQKVWIHVLRSAGVTVEVCRVVEREKIDGNDPMLNAPRKHKVVRVYRADEGKENSPIDLDGDDDFESEEELSAKNGIEAEERCSKRTKVG